MSNHDDNARDAGLTPEERALARRLAKLGPQGEPSPSIDAHILAAAHAAVRPTVHARRKVSKWPATFGMAASLAIACGIAWQLRPAPELPAASVQKIEADEGVEYRAPPPMSAREVPRRPLNMPTPPPAEQAAPRRRANIRPATRADEQQKPQSFAMEPPIVLDEAVHPAPAAAAAPAAPPAADVEVVGSGVINPIDVESVESTTVLTAEQIARKQEQREAGAASANQARERAAAKARAEPQFAEPDEEVVPPATADSPAVRDAWLQRIRELVRDGQLDAARESLKAFRTRYPGHAIPDDLHAIEE